MNIIQEWNKINKDKLLLFIINNIDCEYKDVIICGSRVFGGFRPNSDIDVLVLIDNYNNKSSVVLSFSDVINEEHPSGKFTLTITFNDYFKVNNNNYYWISLGYVYHLPCYSILNNILYEGDNNSILHHTKLAKLIIEYNGIDVPFEKFNLENDYLLDYKK